MSNETPPPDEKLREAVSRLVYACNYRDAIMASQHADKLDFAVENYSRALWRCQELLRGAESEQ